MLTGPVLAIAAANRWLIAFSAAALLILAGDTLARRLATRASGGTGATRAASNIRAVVCLGAAVVLVAVVGLVAGGSSDSILVTMALGASAVAGFELVRSVRHGPEWATVLATTVAAIVAVAAGARFGPTGVGVFDVVGAVVVIVAATFAIGGLGSGVGVLAAAGVLAPAAFGGQDGLATVAAALIGLSVGSAALGAAEVPARAARLAVGFGVGVGVFALEPVAGQARPAITPIIVLALVLLDAVTVVVGRYDRRLPLWGRRRDHLGDRLEARGWSHSAAMVVLTVAQGVLSITALVCDRAVAPTWLGAAIAGVVVVFVAVAAGAARLEPAPVRRTRRWVVLGVIAAVVAAAVVSVPLALAAPDAYHAMQHGRDDAKQALSSARNGDTERALTEFRAAAHQFELARDRLGSPLVAGTLAVPVLAANVRAARTLADIGNDLADAGVSLTAAVNPEALKVTGGRLPLEEVRKVTPQLEDGTAVLTDALARLDDVRNDPYLAGPVRDAVDKVHQQLLRAQREAAHASAAATLAPAIFGAEGDRRYLLVVQNNAESRATGGFIGSYAIVTAHDGKLSVGPIERDATWNNAMRALPDPKLVAPPGYIDRYAQFSPQTTVQNVNLAPGFPTVAGVLMNLATQQGIGAVDGVIAVDPLGLAALLRLTGPVEVEGWPDPINADNVVQVTLKDAYEAFARSPERVDFLGDVARAAVDKATSETLGKPTEIAKVLGKAAHGGHLVLAFKRPDEQRLSEQLGVALQMSPVRSDAIAVTTSNAAANKIDYYLDRTVRYDVHLQPNNDATEALARGQLSVALTNNAPDQGLPESVIGPFRPGFYAGENKSYVSLYSPLAFTSAAVDGKQVGISTLVEDGRNVGSLYADMSSHTSKTVAVDLAGVMKLHGGWYSVEIRHQPTLNADRVVVNVEVPKGWRIDQASHMRVISPQHATTRMSLERAETPRVHLVRDHSANLWERLQAGS